MKYGIFDLKFSSEEEEVFIQSCRDILNTGFLTNHDYVKKFERKFSHIQDAPFAIACSSGTSAIEIALRAIDVKGKYVIIPSNTFIATAVAAINAGATPLILDIEPDWFGLSPVQLEKTLIQDHDKEIACIIAVHIGGHIAPSFERVMELSQQFNIPLLEDCAQAHFSTLKGINAGNFGIAGCFSFFTTKVMTTGEGGIIVTKDEHFEKKLRQVRQFGMDLERPTQHIRDGANFKMNEFSAALGVMELTRVSKRILRRRELAKIYQQQLIPSLFRVISDPPNVQSSHYKQIVVLQDGLKRKALEIFLQKEGIPLTGGVYYGPLHQQPRLKRFITHDNYPHSDFFAHHHFCPPCYPELENSAVQNICDAINHWGEKQ